MAVERERTGDEVVASIPVDVVGRDEARDLLRDRVHPGRRNDVEAVRVRGSVAERIVRVTRQHPELRAARAVGIARQGIVDRSWRQGEVALQHRHRRHRHGPVDGPVVSGGLVADEEEGLVLRDGTSDGAAELVVARLRLVAGVQGDVAKPHRPRLQVLVGVMLERRSVDGVGSTPGLQIDGRPAGEALLRVHAVGDDVDLLDRLESRDVGDHVRKLDVGGADAVDAGIVLIVARPVDRELERPRRVGGDRVRVAGGRKAGQHSVHLLIVPTQGHGEVRQLRAHQVHVDLGGLGLQLRRLGADGDGVAHGADLEADVDANDAVDVDRDLGPLEGLEALLAGLETVDTRGQVGEVETPGPVGDCLARQAGALVDDTDRSAPDGSA